MVPLIFIAFTSSEKYGNSTHHLATPSQLVESISTMQTGCIDGNIFQDQNLDGENNSEPGIANIEIEIFDCNNILVGNAFTDNLGDWQICGLASNTDYRIEVKLSAAQSNIYNPAISGIDNGSNVQFAQENAMLSYGLAIKNFTPLIITSCYSFAGYQGANKDIEALIGVPINEINDPNVDAVTNIIQYATHEEIGSTYGLSINPITNKAYVAAYMKRHAGFGPSGTGAIYEVDLDLNNAPVVVADLNAIYGANTAGINPHDYAETDLCPVSGGASTNFQCWYNDVDAWNAVGRTSLGDMDISANYDTLFVMNLEDRSVYPIDLNNPGAVQTSFPFPLDQDTDSNVTLKPRDPAYDIRPFAMKYHNGKIYVGAVDSEQSRDRDNICCAKGGAVIYIYSLDPSTGIWTLELEENIQRNGPSPPTPFFIRWTEDFNDDFNDNGHMIISDIEFDGLDLVVGLRDLSADKYGNGHGKPIVGSTAQLHYGSVAGDIIRFCYDSSSSTYNFENNGSCGGITTSGAGSFNYGWPEASTPRGSYYTGDRFSTNHPQTSLGGIWQDPNSERVYSSAFDISSVFDSGLIALDNTTGLRTESYILINDTQANNGFGKGASLGDLESNAQFLPIEIGNLVWCDSIPNGIQDACENGIADMIVQLYNEIGLLIGQDTTDVIGQYYFNSNNVDTTGITVDASGVATPNTLWNGPGQGVKYYIVFGNGQYDNSSQVYTISGQTYHGLAPFDANNNVNDNIDSDVDPTNLTSANGSIPAGLPQICLTTETTNCVNHNFDLGLVCTIFDLALTKTVNTGASANPIIAGSNVVFDITIINQGEMDAFDIDIQEYFNASELTFVNLQAPATSSNGVMVSVVGTGPNFELEFLEAGDEVSIQLTFTIDSNFGGTNIINNAEIIAASIIDNGVTAVDEDSPLTIINDGTINELATDNDVADDSTGGIDNAADEDDYDPAEVTVLCQFESCLPITITRN